ncbi:MAG: hypothetical protein H0U63_03250, partial [Burkholderiales bacterium]|nr:hypothetical protein [Burkholderiales bacterium]
MATQVTKVEPWDPQGEGWKYGYGQAKALYNANQKYRPTFGRASELGLTEIARTAQSPNLLARQAVNTVKDVAAGVGGINTGGMFGNVYDAATGPGMLQGGAYGDIAGGQRFVSPGEFNRIGQQAQRPGSLSDGRYNDVASGAHYVDTAPQFGRIENQLEQPGRLSSGPVSGIADASRFIDTGATYNRIGAQNEGRGGLGEGGSAYNRMAEGLGGVNSGGFEQLY